MTTGMSRDRNLLVLATVASSAKNVGWNILWKRLMDGDLKHLPLTKFSYTPVSMDFYMMPRKLPDPPFGHNACFVCHAEPLFIEFRTMRTRKKAFPQQNNSLSLWHSRQHGEQFAFAFIELMLAKIL
jgi:hypothetical protein